MANTRDALSLLIKQHIAHRIDVTGYQDYIHLIVDIYKAFKLPVCESIGTRTHTACGCILCPYCEFSRRWQFGRSIAWNLRWDVDDGPIDPYEVAVVQHVIETSSLLGLADDSPGAFRDPSILRRFRALDGLLGWIVNVEWSRSRGLWTLTRTAVTAVKPPQFRKGVPLLVRGITDFPPIDERSFNDNIGEKAAIVLAAISVGHTLFSLSEDMQDEEYEYSIIEACAAIRRMRDSSQRLHLLRCLSPRSFEERMKMQDHGY